MNALLPGTFDFHALMRATAQNESTDVFRPALSTAQWAVFAPYLHPLAARPGQVLIEQHATDRTVYFIEDGALTVHFEDSAGRIRLAKVERGSAVGEGAFFSRQPRSATVQAATSCRLWYLTPLRFGELSYLQPAIALEVSMALGGLVTRRLAYSPRQVAVT
jgi:CRP/FNR family transcriptional regulator, cyclic AMP receptor protein